MNMPEKKWFISYMVTYEGTSHATYFGMRCLVDLKRRHPVQVITDWNARNEGKESYVLLGFFEVDVSMPDLDRQTKVFSGESA